MPWGWECRQKLLKQVPPKPVVKRPTPYDDFQFPGPGHYEPPEIYCGKGFSRIRRAPAYSFGYNTPVSINKPAIRPNAPILNIRNQHRKGWHRITHSIMRPYCVFPKEVNFGPGPAAYLPDNSANMKHQPKYSMRKAAKPLYQPWDQWTPGPNMYYPPIPSKKPPTYSLGKPFKDIGSSDTPGPGQHDPKFEFVKKTKPAFSLKGKLKDPPPSTKVPAPNTYCEKMFMCGKRSTPAPSFGIRHSPWLGKPEVYLKSSTLEMLARDLI